MTSRHPATALTLALTLAVQLAAPVAGQPPRVEDVRRTPIVEVVERVSPAVVNISAESMVRQPAPSSAASSRAGGPRPRSARG